MKVRLLDLAHARSGDKGDTANVGVIALKPEWYPFIAEQLSLDRVRKHFAGMIDGDVERFELPNHNALNFLKTAGAVLDEFFVDQFVANSDMQQTVRQS